MAQAEVLESPDLLNIVLSHHARQSAGWGRILWKAAAVCTRWHDIILSLRPALEEWSELEYTFPPPTAVDPGIVYSSPVFLSGLGSYGWQAEFLPGGIQEDGPMCLLVQAKWAGRAHAPVAAEDSRLAQLSFELCSKSGVPLHSRHPRFFTFVRDHDPEQDSYLTCEQMVHYTCVYEHEVADELMRVWTEDKSLVLRVRARAINGRHLCGNQSGLPCGHLMPVHSLALTANDAVYNFDRWFCDHCHRDQGRGEAGFDEMYHCTFGCDYDLCKKCFTAMERKKTLRRRPPRRRIG